MAFLTHFQFSVRYETGTYLLTSLKQYTVTHISDHIHEWRRRSRLIKFEIADQLPTKWFTKSFITPIAHDMAMGGCVTEEQAIARKPHISMACIPQKCKMLDLGTNQHGDCGSMTWLVQHESAIGRSDPILPPCVFGTSEECLHPSIL